MFKEVTNNPVDYVNWDDPNELVNRLILLVASQSAGHTGRAPASTCSKRAVHAGGISKGRQIAFWRRCACFTFENLHAHKTKILIIYCA
jgi:hypothetical protein